MMRVQYFAIFVLCLMTTVATAEEKQYAVLVGIEKYFHSNLSDLEYAVEDVTELAGILKQRGYDVRLLTDETGKKDNALTPTRVNVEKQIHDVLARCRPEDTILIAFAGHGLQFTGQNDAYFCPVDARPFPDETETLVSISNIYAEFEKSFAGVKVILVDACRNDPDPGRGRGGLDADAVPRPPRGVAALFSCSAGQRAFEHDELKHGVFFHYVLEGLKNEAVDKNGVVTFDGLASYVRTNVPKRVRELFATQSFNQFPNLKADLVGVPPVLLRSAPAKEALSKQEVGQRLQLAKEIVRTVANNVADNNKQTNPTNDNDRAEILLGWNHAQLGHVPEVTALVRRRIGKLNDARDPNEIFIKTEKERLARTVGLLKRRAPGADVEKLLSALKECASYTFSNEVGGWYFDSDAFSQKTEAISASRLSHSIDLGIDAMALVAILETNGAATVKMLDSSPELRSRIQHSYLEVDSKELTANDVTKSFRLVIASCCGDLSLVRTFVDEKIPFPTPAWAVVPFAHRNNAEMVSELIAGLPVEIRPTGIYFAVNAYLDSGLRMQAEALFEKYPNWYAGIVLFDDWIGVRTPGDIYTSNSGVSHLVNGDWSTLGRLGKVELARKQIKLLPNVGSGQRVSQNVAWMQFVDGLLQDCFPDSK